MNAFKSTLICTALSLALSGAAFAEEPTITPDPPAGQTSDPDPAESGDPIPSEPMTATSATLPSAGPRTQPAFADLDTDADGFVAQTDIPAEHELSLQFAVADTDADAKLSQAEFEAYQSAPEEEEAEE